MIKAIIMFRIVHFLSQFKPMRWWLGGHWYKLTIRDDNTSRYRYTMWTPICPSPFDSPYDKVIKEEKYESKK